MRVMVVGTVPTLALLSHRLCPAVAQTLDVYPVCVCMGVCGAVLEIMLLPLRALSSWNLDCSWGDNRFTSHPFLKFALHLVFILKR